MRPVPQRHDDDGSNDHNHFHYVINYLRLGLVAYYSVTELYNLATVRLLQIEWYSRLLSRHLLKLGCIFFTCGACFINKVPSIHNGIVFLVF